MALSPVRIETVRGKPISALGRTFVPLVRVLSVSVHRGTVHKLGVEGRGGGLVFARPVAVIEQDRGMERTIRIRDVTALTMQAMGIVACVVSVVAMILIVANRRVK